MTTPNPITPPPELVQQWASEWMRSEAALPVCRVSRDNFIAARAAQWGADQELEACLRHLDAKGHHPTVLDALRAARRPQPPSLKEQALALVEQHEEGWRPSPKDWDTIRRALEALDD
jgi:hypothetical protein